MTDTPIRHTCHWPGCENEVPPAMWGCRQHWMKLPKELRGKIWATYKTGQEIRRDPSPEYLAAAKEVRDWILQFQDEERVALRRVQGRASL